MSDVTTFLVGAGTAFVTTSFGFLSQTASGRMLFKFQLRHQHLQDQRKQMYELISRYRGRVLEAALDWDRRADQMYLGSYRQLDPPDECRRDRQQYYYHSVVFRFLQLTGIARRFEAEAFSFDDQVARRDDFDLVRYAKAFLWVMIHAEISPSDGMPGIDHFRSDAFRPLLDLCYAEPSDDEGRPILPATRGHDDELIFDYQRFLAILGTDDAELPWSSQVDELLAFFDGVRPDELDTEQGRRRRRWDRLVALHLLVMAFIHTCGYRWHHRGRLDARTDEVCGRLLYPDNLLEQFTVWLPRMGLEEDGDIKAVMCSLRRAAASVEGFSDEDRLKRVMAGLPDANASAPPTGDPASQDELAALAGGRPAAAPSGR